MNCSSSLETSCHSCRFLTIAGPSTAPNGPATCGILKLISPRQLDYWVTALLTISGRAYMRPLPGTLEPCVGRSADELVVRPEVCLLEQGGRIRCPLRDTNPKGCRYAAAG